MKPQPTGRIDGNDLILTRKFRAPIEDVWTSITESESCARWFARWEGDPGPGKTIRWQMTHEKGDSWTDVTIDRCDAPRHLAVTSQGPYAWSLELTLKQTGDTTEMTFVHHLTEKDKAMKGDIGTGWEYYLDMLAATRANATLPVWDDYYPAQKQYYIDQG
ncbi:MAG: SRPBCC family protein [Myxococcota bacterium]|nr:SRPBCC family protein [Deltaproteobacteria bacterium]MDQ3335272.1 SRPBCC family protein [Myxococcota bacterium]